jgi:hypothetical protein
MAAVGQPALIISASELDRIKTTVNATGTSFDQSKALARTKAEELNLKSKARAQTWSNTLEGARRKKAQERKDKLEREELERQKLDAEEAQIQLEQRKATIDRANKLMYDESDRIKSFHSKMMYCDVLAEREAQVALKGELKKLEGIREDRFLEMDKQNYRKMLEREVKEKETKEELSRITAKAQKEQLAEYKDKRFKEIEDEMLEGELLKRKAVEDLASEKAIEQRKRQQAMESVKQTQQANVYLKQLKAEEVLKEQRLEEKIEEYAARKEKMLALRKKKEEEVFTAKQDARAKIINEQAERLAAMQDNESQRIEKQVQEKLEADNRKHAEKEELRRRWEADIQKSRHAQIDRKRTQRERERTEDAETAQFLQEWCKVLDRQEAEEVATRRSAAKSLAGEHQKACEISRRKKAEERRLDEGVAVQARKAMEADSAEFHHYAEDVIRHYASDGKNVIPLIKDLRDFRKKSEL